MNPLKLKERMQLPRQTVPLLHGRQDDSLVQKEGALRQGG